MRRRYVASTSLRRHVPAGNLAPLGPPPQYSKPWPLQYSKPSYAYELTQITKMLCSDISIIDMSLLAAHSKAQIRVQSPPLSDHECPYAGAYRRNLSYRRN